MTTTAVDLFDGLMKELGHQAKAYAVGYSAMVKMVLPKGPPSEVMLAGDTYWHLLRLVEQTWHDRNAESVLFIELKPKDRKPFIVFPDLRLVVHEYDEALAPTGVTPAETLDHLSRWYAGRERHGKTYFFSYFREQYMTNVWIKEILVKYGLREEKHFQYYCTLKGFDWHYGFDGDRRVADQRLEEHRVMCEEITKDPMKAAVYAVFVKEEPYYGQFLINAVVPEPIPVN